MADEFYKAIFSRVSTRSFDHEPLSAAEEAVLHASMEANSGAGPFGRRVRFALAEGHRGGDPVRMGTYGLISGAAAYLVAAVERGEGAMEDFGRAVEGVVLAATAAGLSSCWIGGVFSRGRAVEAMGGIAATEIVPAVVALGRPAARRSLADRVVMGMAGSRRRAEADSMFFATADGSADHASDPGAGSGTAAAAGGTPGTPAEPASRFLPLRAGGVPEAWITALEAVRLGPSASNKQPWRVVRLPPDRHSAPAAADSSGNDWLFLLHEDRVYNSALGEAKMQNIDMGIAMRHFEIACATLGLPGSWDVSADATGHAAAAIKARLPHLIPIARWTNP